MGVLNRGVCGLAGVLLGVALQGCRPGSRADAVVIPQAPGPPTASESRWVAGLDYRPMDLPLVWLPSDSILVWHQESYAKFDVGGSTCAGSGVYLVPGNGLGRARPTQVGEPVCAAVEGDGIAADPTGRFVVYSVRTYPNSSRLMRLDLASGRADSLVPGCRVYAQEPAISPDGRALAFTGMCESRDQPEWAVYVADMADVAPRRVYGGDSVSARWPAWSPDGRSLAVVLERDSAAHYRMDIAVVDVASGRGRVLGQGWGPSWSPYGRWLAYVEDERDLSGGAIRVVSQDGSADHRVFSNRLVTTFPNGWGRTREGQPMWPLVWGPDSRTIFFSRIFKRGSSLWSVDVETGRALQITAPARPTR